MDLAMTDPAPGPALPCTLRGPESGTPIVLLHGFGGDVETWINIRVALEGRHRVIAFDLPGHGRAFGWPEIGNARVTAKAVLQSLEAMGLDRVHLVGHSMGGATAFLVAAKAPERVASLTLIAPGGFGPEVNHRLLRHYAVARTVEEITPLLEQFFGDSVVLPPSIPRRIAAEREANPTLVANYAAISETIVTATGQPELKRDMLATVPYPVKLIWGEMDRVIPASQTRNVPPNVGVHLLPGVGHMPHAEAPRIVYRLILENVAAGDGLAAARAR